MKTMHRIQQGFTLIELMVTIALVAILMAVAVPSMTTFQRNAELTSFSNTLIGSVNAARSEGIKRGRNSMIVPANGTDWGSGWIVFVDIDSPSTFTYSAANDLTVLTREAAPTYLTITPTGTANESPPYMLFDASGYARNKLGGFGALTLSVARNDVPSAELYSQTRRLKISSVGRVKVCKPTSATDANCLDSGG